MRLGKKAKESESKSQIVDGINRLICTTKTQSYSLKGKKSFVPPKLGALLSKVRNHFYHQNWELYHQNSELFSQEWKFISTTKTLNYLFSQRW